MIMFLQYLHMNPFGTVSLLFQLEYKDDFERLMQYFSILMFRLSQLNSTIVSMHNSFLQQKKKPKISKTQRKKLLNSSKVWNFLKKNTDHSPNIFVSRINPKFV